MSEKKLLLRKLANLRHDLGPLGLAALVALGALMAFRLLVLEPLEARDAALHERVARQAPQASAQAELPASTPAKVAAVYDFLRKEEETTDWLAKLYGIGTATGVEVKSATYRTQPTAARIVRYEIVLPVAGTYPQLRDFLGRALTEIPVLSLDQITLKRENRSDGGVHAELRMTLHMVKS